MRPVGLPAVTPVPGPPRSPTTATGGGAARVASGLHDVRNSSHRPVGCAASGLRAFRDPPATHKALKACIEAGDAAGALLTFRTMQDLEIDHGPRTFTMVMNAFAQNGETDVVERLFDELPEEDKNDPVFFNVRIKAFGNACDAARSRALFDAMPGKGVERDVFTVNAMLAALANVGDVEGALALWDGMASLDPPVKANEATYTTMIGLLGRAGRRDRALELFWAMPGAGLSHEGASVGAAMNACAELGDVEATIDLLRKMRARGIAGDVRNDHIAIKACLNARSLEHAREVFDAMCKAGPRAKPNADTFNLMITVCGATGRLDQALDLRREMQQRWGLRPNRATDIALVVAHASCGKIAEAVRRFEQRFLDDGVRDAIAVSLSRFRDPDAAHAWFSALCEREPTLCVDLGLWCILVELAARAGHDTDRVIEAARAAGAVGRDAGLRDDVLDFHTRAVGGPETPGDGHDPCVSSAMARALMAFHKDRITATTQYVVGQRGRDRVKQEVKAILHAQARRYVEHPRNPGRLIPAQVDSAATMGKAPVDWWDATG